MRHHWQLSLRSQLLVQTALGVGIVLAALVAISAQTLNASTQQILEERKVTAVVLAEGFSSQLDHAMGMLEGAVDEERKQSDADTADLDGRLPQRAYGQSVVFTRVDLLGADGVELGTAPSTDHQAGMDMTLPPYSIPISQATRPIYVATDGAETRGPGVALVVPICGPTGDITGYLVGWIDLSDPRAKSLFQPHEPAGGGAIYPQESGGYTDLVDEHGTVIVSSRPARIGLVTDHNGRFNSLIQGKQATVGTCHSCHDAEGSDRQPEVLAFAPVSLVGWGVALRQSEDEVFAPVRALSAQLTGIGLVVMAVFLGFAWVAARSVVSPLRSLTRSCQDIANGDFSRPIPPSGPSEVSDLARSFEGMRLALGGYRDQVDAFRRELEQRVEDRTAELERTHDHLLRTNRNLTSLNAVAATLSQSLNLTETLKGALDRTLDAVNANIGGIYLPSPDDGTLALATHRGLPAESLALIQQLPSRDAESNQDTAASSLWQSAWRGYLSAKLKLPALLCVPLEARGQLQGLLFAAQEDVDPLVHLDQTLLASIGWQIALTLRNVRLYDDIQREERARAGLLHRVIAAQEDERKRIARELHDDTSQALTALMIGLDTASADLTANPQAAADRLAADKAIARQLLVDVKRLISDLRPSLLDDLGLVPAITWYGERRLKPLGVDFRVEDRGLERRLPPDVETALFRIAQEAVNNVARHAGATSVVVSVQSRRNCISLRVADDGRGFDSQTMRGAAAPDQGHGLLGIQERVSILQGEFHVDSGEGHGTILTVRVPIVAQREVKDGSDPCAAG